MALPTGMGLKMGVVALWVSDLKRSVQWYQNTLGLKAIKQSEGSAEVGAGSQTLISLTEKSGAQPYPQTSGLYHVAILLPDRKSLARLLYQLAENEIEIEGAADHGVSESLYLRDPDGNGIEIYRDRRKNDWPRDDIQHLQMGTEEMDFDSLILELKKGVLPWQGLPEKTVIGHIHLQVADLKRTEAFYQQGLGFTLTQRADGAIFLADGEYHHHIAANNWAGEEIPPAPADATGLRWFELRFADAAALEAVQAKLQAAQIPMQAEDGSILIHDPDQIAIWLRK